ncbi:MAG: hypothetical protein LBE76_05045 [Nitrososphaerota archaeon]|jgi:hypothetical protein|nr:hypothetical protein [Nitrososphaerota archaeon]
MGLHVFKQVLQQVSSNGGRSARYYSNAWQFNLGNAMFLFQVLGTNSGGGGGGSWNGGTITSPIELKHNFTEVIGKLQLQNLLYEEWANQLPYMPSTPVGYTLKDNITSNFNRIFGIIIKQNSGSAGSPAVGLTHHLFVRGDFQVRGMIDSKEGVFVAHGGPKLIGWGPEGYGNLPNAKRNPMLLIKNDDRPDNTAPDTWETRIMSSTGVYIHGQALKLTT